MDKILRDEIAMSMPVKALPTAKNEEGVVELSAALGLEVPTDAQSALKWSMDMQARVRYMYADAMLAARK